MIEEFGRAIQEQRDPEAIRGRSSQDAEGARRLGEIGARRPSSGREMTDAFVWRGWRPLPRRKPDFQTKVQFRRNFKVSSITSAATSQTKAPSLGQIESATAATAQDKHARLHFDLLL